MYIPNYFKNRNLREVRDFIKQNSFGILVNTTDGRPCGTHIPLELETDPDGEEVLYGHISRANQQLNAHDEAEDVLLIFNGPHAYVSSSWYGHENVPTWNYVAVHVYGKLQIIDGEEVLYALDKLMNKYEEHSENPVRMQDLSESTMRQVRGIIAFKVYIKDIQAAYKLSQNRNDEDYDHVVQQLGKSDNTTDQNVSQIMKSKR